MVRRLVILRQAGEKRPLCMVPHVHFSNSVVETRGGSSRGRWEEAGSFLLEAAAALGESPQGKQPLCSASASPFFFLMVSV